MFPTVDITLSASCISPASPIYVAGMGGTQKRLITWRVDEGLLGRIDARAAAVGRSRSAWLVWAAETALEDQERGVPDPPKPKGVQQAVERQAKVREPAPAGYVIPKIAPRGWVR
jgi:hypothetical protein